jgi:2,4-dienoyl-CoA reductase-like NADH-dependent reductase (Old Yellow Enzyme family)
MSKLFSQLQVKAVQFKNRLVVSPMCQYSAEDGFASDWHLVHYGSRAVGGAALVIQEATAVSPEGRITPGDLGLFREEHIGRLQSITRFICNQGAVPGIQLAHAGRKASCDLPWKGGSQLKESDGGWQTVAPSAIPFNPEDHIPQTLDLEGIGKVIGDFKESARRSFEAGYQVLEIHAAHGYLIHQFLSPLSNCRSDNYGGGFENRSRLLLAIVNAVHTEWPDHLPLFVRISATDWVEGGWNIDEAVQLSSILKTVGVDLIDCSSGGMVPYAKIPARPGYQVPLAKRIKKGAEILTSAVGLITEPQQAEEILEDGAADLILLGRELLREPYFGLKAAKVTGDETQWPLQYLRAKPQ